MQSFLEGSCSTQALGHWQKHLLSEGLWEYGTYARQVKKLDARHWKSVQESLSQGQIESKIWLFEVLKDVLPQGQYSLQVGGGWTGMTALMSFWLMPHLVKDCCSFDIDPECAEIANSLNEPYSWNGMLDVKTMDLHAAAFAPHQPHIIINTVCEHLTNFKGWFEAIPSGQFVVLQNNDFYEGRDHVNCVADLHAFEQQAPLSTILFSGELELFGYKRFMQIGVK